MYSMTFDRALFHPDYLGHSLLLTYIPILCCLVDLLRRKEEHIRMLEQIQQQEEMLKNKYVQERENVFVVLYTHCLHASIRTTYDPSGALRTIASCRISPTYTRGLKQCLNHINLQLLRLASV